MHDAVLKLIHEEASEVIDRHRAVGFVGEQEGTRTAVFGSAMEGEVQNPVVEALVPPTTHIVFELGPRPHVAVDVFDVLETLEHIEHRQD